MIYLWFTLVGCFVGSFVGYYFPRSRHEHTPRIVRLLAAPRAPGPYVFDTWEVPGEEDHDPRTCVDCARIHDRPAPTSLPGPGERLS